MRITIERNGDILRFSALSETAVVPVRQVEIQSFFATGAAVRLMESQTIEEQGRRYSFDFEREDFSEPSDRPRYAAVQRGRESPSV